MTQVTSSQMDRFVFGNQFSNLQVNVLRPSVRKRIMEVGLLPDSLRNIADNIRNDVEGYVDIDCFYGGNVELEYYYCFILKTIEQANVTNNQTNNYFYYVFVLDTSRGVLYRLKEVYKLSNNDPYFTNSKGFIMPIN